MVAAAARLDDGARPACVMGVDCGARETASRMGCYDARVGCVRACVCVCVSVPVSVLRCPSRPRSERMRTTCANRCPPGAGGVGRSFPTRTGGGPHHHAHRVCVQRESGRCESVSVAFSVFARGLEKTVRLKSGPRAPPGTCGCILPSSPSAALGSPSFIHRSSHPTHLARLA